jgi:hypothetical protein
LSIASRVVETEEVGSLEGAEKKRRNKADIQSDQSGGISSNQQATCSSLFSWSTLLSALRLNLILVLADLHVQTKFTTSGFLISRYRFYFFNCYVEKRNKPSVVCSLCHTARSIWRASKPRGTKNWLKIVL